MHVDYDSNNEHTPPPIPTFGWTGGLETRLHLELQVCTTQDDEPVIQDDEPVIVTRSKRRKMNDNNEDHWVAKKAAPKRKQLRK
jgi:hypothetical protein